MSLSKTVQLQSSVPSKLGLLQSVSSTVLANIDASVKKGKT
jgi:hypothetical protein